MPRTAALPRLSRASDLPLPGRPQNPGGAAAGASRL